MRAATQLASVLMQVCSDHTAGGDDLAGRRQPPTRGQVRAAGPHPGQPRRLLRALGEDLGVPGAAQGAAGGRRPRPRAGVRRGGAPARVVGGRAGRLRRRGAGDASPRARPHPRQPGRAPAQARVRWAARRRVRRPAAADGARPHRRGGPSAHDAERPGAPDRAGVRRPRGRSLPARRLRVPAPARAPDPALPAAPHARRARGGGGAAPAGPLARLQQGARARARRGVALPPARGAPPAPEAVLPTAALRRRADQGRRGPAESRCCAGAAGRPRLPRPERRPATHRGTHRRGHPHGPDPAHPAARHARVVRRRTRSRRRAVRLPSDLRGARCHAVVPPPPARRGRGRPADGAGARDQPVRHRPAPARAPGRRDPRRAGTPRAADPGHDPERDGVRGRTTRRRRRGGQRDPRDPSA